MEYPFQTFTAIEYLMIDIANNFGLDHEDWVDRLIWFQLNKDDLMSQLEQAEEPALYYAGVQAYHNAMLGNINTYPISLDATCSGMQILSVLTGDIKAARLCNVVGIGSRADAYTDIFNMMQAQLNGLADIERKDTKRAIMTSLYSSEKVPEEVFGTGETLRIFHETMEREAPAVWELNKSFIPMWNPEVYKHSWVLPDNGHVEIKIYVDEKHNIEFLDEVYEVKTKINAPKEKGRSLGANLTHSVDGMIVREIVRRCNYDVEEVKRVKYLLTQQAIGNYAWSHSGDQLQQLLKLSNESGYLSSRVLHFINKNTVCLMDEDERNQVLELIASLPPKPFKVLTIHDCFRVLPNYGNDLRYQYNHQLMLIAKSNLLSFLLAQVLEVSHVTIDKFDPEMWKQIMSTEYALS